MKKHSALEKKFTLSFYLFKIENLLAGFDLKLMSEFTSNMFWIKSANLTSGSGSLVNWVQILSVNLQTLTITTVLSWLTIVKGLSILSFTHCSAQALTWWISPPPPFSIVDDVHAYIHPLKMSPYESPHFLNSMKCKELHQELHHFTLFKLCQLTRFCLLSS